MGTKTRRVARTLGIAAGVWLLLVSAVSCLEQVSGAPEDGGPLLPGDLRLKNFPVYAEGVDPLDTDSDREYCVLWALCLCLDYPDSYQDECMEEYLEMFDEESYTNEMCLEFLEEYYPECL